MTFAHDGREPREPARGGPGRDAREPRRPAPGREPLGGPAVVQRVESGLLAAALLVAAVVLYPGAWWALFAAFLVFDLSMLGYLRSPRAGAAGYNAVHGYVAPAVLAVVALLTMPGPVAWWTGLAALSWAFHVAVDRALGYGLKLAAGFEHTHLGRIGRRAR